MFTILDLTTGRLLFAKYDNEVIKGQIAVPEICTITAEDGQEIYFNFETRTFYAK